MARYTGPKTKISRRFGEPIYGPDKYLDRRNFPPGQHGPKRRKKATDYGLQLREKQKAKYVYGMLEKQFRKFYERALASKGNTGEILLQLCESRLDNVVYRLGYASTRREARQLVNHGHITLNGKVCSIPSTIVKAGESFAVRERSKSLEVIQASVASATKYSWIEFDTTTLAGKYLNIPTRNEIPENINEQLIVDLYSK